MAEAQTVLGGANGNADGGAAGNSGGSNNPAGGSTGTPGGTVTSWRDSLPEDIRGNPAIVNFQDVGALAKSYVHAQSLIGKKGVVVPNEKAPPEEWNSFFSQIGVPPADKYTVKTPENYPVDEAVLGQFKEQAMKNGLLPRQADALMEWYANFEKSTLEEHTKETTLETQRQLGELKKEWADGYDKKVRAANLAAKTYGGDEFVQYLDKTGLGNDVRVIKFLERVSTSLGEDKFREGGLSDGYTPAEIQSQIADLRSKAGENGLYDKAHPQHAQSVKKLESLYQQLTRGK